MNPHVRFSLLRCTAVLAALLCSGVPGAFGQAEQFTAVRAEVDFSKHVRDWDGFGFNYVETAQTVDYAKDPQEYGGFSLLSAEEQREIVDLVFGEDGLKVGIVKMFLDPWHQAEPGGAFDHRHSTEYMRRFVREGLRTTRARGSDLQVITTLYGPPAWATQQRFLRGRDLDPARRRDLAGYMVDWVAFLREQEGIPVRYLSLHNEGEDWSRWPADGKSGNIGHGHDYNLFWPPEQVVDFVKLMRETLDARGLEDVGVTPGEPTNWYRLSAWGYADALADDPEAMASLGLVTSHGFYSGTYGKWFGEHRSLGADVLRAQKPDLHVWSTSSSWGKMNTTFVREIYGNIYTAKVNAVIPWAGIQRPPLWVGGDPNPGSAFTVREDGSYEVRPGYYFYKQVTRAGQPGMAVARTMAMDSEVALIGFAPDDTDNPPAFVLVNDSDGERNVSVAVKGTSTRAFEAFRTTEDGNDQYAPAGTFRVEGSRLRYTAPAKSVTTFFGK